MMKIIYFDWRETKNEIPPENVVVLVKKSDGTTDKLKRLSNLWFFPDGSMYVYYTPISWKFIQQDNS